MAKYKPGKSGVPTRKITEIKKKISKEKGKDKSDKNRIAELKKQLAILMAKTQQKQDRISDRDFPTYSVPEDFDGYMNEETMAELRAGASQRDLELGISRIKGNKNYQPLPKNKKGGGKVYTSQNKKYGGGIYPKRGK